MRRTIALFIYSLPFIACSAHDDLEPPLACGDGVVQFEDGESCDDGNHDDGDGCSATCTLEECVWPAPCQPCGNGMLDAPDEECDDGNHDDGDGCSATCSLESDAPSTCGDGVVQFEGGESCDDGNLSDGDGCSAQCTLEGCVWPAPCRACGNGMLDDREECDDGNHDDGDGCSATCSLESDAPSTCGDGILQPEEACDDGNAAGADGCSEVCAVEAGYTCATPGEPCQANACDGDCSVCGDGVLQPGESCDDANSTGLDGCSEACEVEANFGCFVPGEPCVPTMPQ